MSTSTTSTTETRALELLGKGLPPGVVASALGVDPSRITQLLADTEFSSKVVEKKFESLSKHTTRDLAIDKLEDDLLGKLKDTLPFMTRPMEILKSFSVINAAKRRTLGMSPEVSQAQTIVTLNIPSIIIQKFTQNVNNQVTQVGQQSLVTIQSSTMLATAALPPPTVIPVIPMIPVIQETLVELTTPKVEKAQRHLSAYQYKKQSTLSNYKPPTEMENSNEQRRETGFTNSPTSEDASSGQREGTQPVRANARLVASFASR